MFFEILFYDYNHVENMLFNHYVSGDRQTQIHLKLTADLELSKTVFTKVAFCVMVGRRRSTLNELNM